MKRFKTILPLGQGVKFFDKYLESEIGAEIWDALQGLITGFTPSIIKGGTVTGISPAAQIDESIVILNGKILRLAADTGLTYPFYVQEAATTEINAEFGDNVDRPAIDNEFAETSASIPGAGEYVTISAAGSYQNAIASKLQQDWQDITLLVDSTVDDGRTPQYRKDETGRVWLRGSVLVNGGSGLIATLPVGYRIAAGTRVGDILRIPNIDGTDFSAGLAIIIHDNGDIEASNTLAHEYSLDHISYDTEPF